MGKSETVKLYIDNYLSGKTPEFCEQFRNKSVDKQYSAIMSWRRKQRLAEDTPQTCDEIVEHIRRTRTLACNMPDITESEVARIENEISALSHFLSEFKMRIRQREIEELERKRSEIEAKLNELRNR